MKKLLSLLAIPILLTGCGSNNSKADDIVDDKDVEEVEPASVKVVVLAGQSNMEGNTYASFLINHFSGDKVNEYINGYSSSKIVWNNAWGNYKHINPYVNIKIGQGVDEMHFGPELGIAEAIDQENKEETIYFIKFGWGGSNMNHQWRSPSSGETGPIWPAFIEFVKDSLAILELQNLNPKICALCWMQGESDQDSEAIANNYYSRLCDFVKDFRETFDKYAAGPGIGFVDALINKSYVLPFSDIINDAKRRFAETSVINVLVDSLAFNISYDKEPAGSVDIWHCDSDGMIELGHAYAELLLEYFI